MSIPDLNLVVASPLQKISCFKRETYIKRDDLIHPFFNGNKARKLQYLAETHKNEIDQVISWGGCQSNAMYALSCLSRLKKWTFTYYTRQITPFVKKNPVGNLKHALENGMILYEVKSRDFSETIRSLPGKYTDVKKHLVPMGGQSELAEKGVERLASELYVQIAQFELNISDTVIFLSSGTGTTAAYLSKHMPDFQVFTVACVAGGEYLEKQISQICSMPQNLIVLESSLKIPFARPHIELIQTYRELLNAGIEFDLIYDTLAWFWIKKNFDRLKNKNIVFIHSGGVHGNESQLERYRRQGN